jgi:hypothetical protein
VPAELEPEPLAALAILASARDAEREGGGSNDPHGAVLLPTIGGLLGRFTPDPDAPTFAPQPESSLAAS